MRHFVDKYNPRLVRVRSTTARKHQLTAPRVEWTVELTQIVSNTVFFLNQLNAKSNYNLKAQKNGNLSSEYYLLNYITLSYLNAKAKDIYTVLG